VTYEVVYAGSSHGCALVNGGKAFCWGTGGDLGDGTQMSSVTPVRVQGPQTFRVLDVATFTCGVSTNDQVWCWGDNTAGRLGDGTSDHRALPTAVLTGLRFSQVTTGAVHTCGLSLDGEVQCWGSNRFSQLVGHSDTLSLVPVPMAPGRTFAQVEAGGLRTCALDPAGAAHCWGQGFSAGIQPIAGGVVFDQISVGDEHVCGLAPDGEAWCFGQNFDGQLGDGGFVETALGGPPVRVDTDLRFSVISAGHSHTCAVTTGGLAYCWGRDTFGQLGDGDPLNGTDPTEKPLPTPVIVPNTFIRFRSVSAGELTSCGADQNGKGYCWGFGTGNASANSSTKAVELGS